MTVNAKDNLVAEYDFTEAQAEAIVMLQLYRLTNTDIEALKKEHEELEALIKEFEKIYNRKMSKEEVKMIRLAYFMGKTKQFLLKDE